MDQTWEHELIGRGAFLASSMKMPLPAIDLIFEFTRVGHDFLIPISLAVTGSVSAFHLCVVRKTQPIWRAHQEDIPIGAELEALRGYLWMDDDYLRILTLKELPSETRPLILNGLLDIPANFHVVTEWHSRQTSRSTILQFDIGDQVRLVAFKRDYQKRGRTMELRELWLNATAHRGNFHLMRQSAGKVSPYAVFDFNIMR